MLDTMTIMFENHDLSLASPATVSRCGMIYLDENSTGGYRALLESWMAAWSKEMKLDEIKFGSPRTILERI